MVAPAYSEDSYVDHELSNSLDSTFAFEGPEKLLEIWFWASPKALPGCVASEGLRAIPLEKWKTILDLVNCKILSMKSSPALDAYLLSESSLFVFPHKLILKTCGTTTTLACIDKVFEIANAELFGAAAKPALSSKAIHKVFYSRRSFMFPEKQIHVHTDWKREVQLLNEFFIGGKSYVVGDFNSDDHWYLYTGGNGVSGTHGPDGPNDTTFEILMTQLDEKKTSLFMSNRKPGDDFDAENHDLGHDDGAAMMKATGLDSVLVRSEKTSQKEQFWPVQVPSPQLSDKMELSDAEESEEGCEFIHDAFSFTPCGFSSNSSSADSNGFYYTLHVTPESGWSYASFETNFSFRKHSSVDIMDVLLRILSIFSPGKFSVTLFNDTGGKGGPEATFSALYGCDAQLAKLGYFKHEKIVYDLRGEYNLLYLNFEKL